MKYLYEFIGTFFLVLTVGMSVIGPHDAGPLAPLAIGSVLAVMVYAGAHLSGAHYNPAVSLAVYVRGKLSDRDLFFYWIAQLVGGAAAAFLTLYLKEHAAETAITMQPLQALIAEFLFTFALCYVVLNVATAKATSGNSFYGFAIGFTVLAGAYAVGAISGAAFNPAVALGITLMNLSHWSNFWVFVVGNLAGGAAAALLFKAAHPGE
jgi:aquaporin Z